MIICCCKAKWSFTKTAFWHKFLVSTRFYVESFKMALVTSILTRTISSYSIAWFFPTWHREKVLFYFITEVLFVITEIHIIVPILSLCRGATSDEIQFVDSYFCRRYPVRSYLGYKHSDCIFLRQSDITKTDRIMSAVLDELIYCHMPLPRTASWTSRALFPEVVNSHIRTALAPISLALHCKGVLFCSSEQKFIHFFQQERGKNFVYDPTLRRLRNFAFFDSPHLVIKCNPLGP